jgi:hypothetical protein
MTSVTINLEDMLLKGIEYVKLYQEVDLNKTIMLNPHKIYKILMIRI